MDKYKPMDIHCPECGRCVGTYDGKSKIPFTAKCKSCKKLISFNPETKEICIKNIPPRFYGSGMRFY